MSSTSIGDASFIDLDPVVPSSCFGDPVVSSTSIGDASSVSTYVFFDPVVPSSCPDDHSGPVVFRF